MVPVLEDINVAAMIQVRADYENGRARRLPMRVPLLAGRGFCRMLWPKRRRPRLLPVRLTLSGRSLPQILPILPGRPE